MQEQKTRNYKDSEWRCRDECGLGAQNMHPEILMKADYYRECTGKPAIITSAARCEKHNKAVGGKPNSYHLIKESGYCEAVDFEVNGFDDLKLSVTSAIVAGFNGIGICVDEHGKGFIHCDLGANRLFIYRK
jgi:zinc D-Ala-D-Ala carboxypeptidase